MAARTPNQPAEPSPAPKKPSPRKGRKAPATPRNTAISRAAAEKRKKAIELRIGGATFAQIAQKVGYADKASAYRAVQEELRSIPAEAAAELRQMDLERLDVLWMRNYTRLLQGDLTVTNALLRIMDQRAKLAGTYQIAEQQGPAAEVQAMFSGMLTSAMQFAADQDAKHQAAQGEPDA